MMMFIVVFLYFYMDYKFFQSELRSDELAILKKDPHFFDVPQAHK